MKPGIGLLLGKRGCGQRRHPLDRRCRKRFAEQRAAAVEQFDRGLRKLSFGSGRKRSLNQIAGHQHRAHPPTASAADIGGLEAMVGGHQSNHAAIFAMDPKGKDDGGGLDPHALGWK